MKAIIMDADGVVVNVGIWDDSSTPPADMTVEIVEDDNPVGPGYRKVGETFVAPDPNFPPTL